MKLTALTLTSLDIPFKVSFSHASATRNKTQTAWVTACADTVIGYGESCPRAYVTGEDMVTVNAFFARHHDDIISSIHDMASLKRWVDLHEVDIDQHPAAWCAIELALLDLFGNQVGSNIEVLLAVTTLQGEYVYTAVLGDSPLEAYAKQVKQYAAMGFEDFKIKITDDVATNQVKINLVKQSIPSARIRLDANNLWTDADMAIQQLTKLPGPLFAVEEPLAAGDVQGMNAIADALGIKMILDESFLNKSHFQFLLDKPEHWIINLRVSKVGGLIRGLECAALAKQYGISCIVGAQVGETSLLTRAGLTLAQACKPNLLAQEGAYGLHLLEEDICEQPLMFGQQGKLDASKVSSLAQPGFGLAINVTHSKNKRGQ